MKKLTSNSFLVTAVVIFSIAVTVFSTTLAQGGDGDNLELQMEELVLIQKELAESQLKLTEALGGNTPSPEGPDDFKADLEPQQIGGDGTKFPPSNICTDDYQEWPSSDTFKKSNWSTEYFYNWYSSDFSGSYFNDINGDGLVDNFYMNRTDDRLWSCVYLNNGSGWDLAQKCYAKENNDAWTFWGDCAA